MDIEHYLQRINYQGPRTSTIETLRSLQRAHLLAVPFENISIHIGEPIVLQDEALYNKIVERRRGGFCYELNGLFSALLRTLGFNVTKLSLRLAQGEGETLYSPEFEHMALMVSLEDPWLVDVGYGGKLMEPLLLNSRDVQVQCGYTFRITSEGEDFFLSERTDEDQWKPRSRFSLQPRQYADFVERCHFQQTDPESHFIKGRFCRQETPEKWMILHETEFIEIEPNGDRHEQTVANQEIFGLLMHKHFGIVVENRQESPPS